MNLLIFIASVTSYLFTSIKGLAIENAKAEAIISHKIEIEAEAIEEYEKQIIYYATNTYEVNYEPGVLNKRDGVNYNENGNKETYYNLPMSRVVQNAKDNGLEGDYWVRDDGVKMFGDYVIVAANQDNYAYGTTVETSLGTAIVLDTGSFAEANPEQFDVAVDW